MPHKVEANTNPEELGFGERFKERHDGLGDGNHDTKFFQFYSREVCDREKNIRLRYRTNGHANFREDLDGQDHHLRCGGF